MSFSAKALLPTDPPAFSDDEGKVSVDWLRSFGLLSDHEYCCWRSNWTTHSDWEYSMNFGHPFWKKSPTDEKNAVVQGTNVRRRTLRQVECCCLAYEDATASPSRS